MLQTYLGPGHKIGKPQPLFTKIEQAQLDELKKKYGGVQGDSQKAENKAPTAFKSLQEIEAAVAEQGNKVRALKAAKAEKVVVTEQVNILLALKKQLEEFKLAPPQPVSSVAPSVKTIQEAEAAVTEQGNKVRALKAAKTEKAVVTEQVNVLLALKKQLEDLKLTSANTTATPAPLTNGTAPPSADKIAEIEAEIVKQGEKVRDLKASADKNVWQPEVAKLLELKEQLKAAGGNPAPAPQSSGKNKKKK